MATTGRHADLARAVEVERPGRRHRVEDRRCLPPGRGEPPTKQRLLLGGAVQRRTAVVAHGGAEHRDVVARAVPGEFVPPAAELRDDAHPLGHLEARAPEVHEVAATTQLGRPLDEHGLMPQAQKPVGQRGTGNPGADDQHPHVATSRSGQH
jgi:hypothetical protein